MALELTLQAGRQRRGGDAASDLLLDLLGVGETAGAELLLELAKEPADFGPMSFLFFRLRCRRRRRGDPVQLLARTLERAGQRGGRRVAGKPRRALPGEGGEPLAESGDICLRASAIDLGAQRLGERGGGAELAQRLNVRVDALVR